jgi:hypothetical protein
MRGAKWRGTLAGSSCESPHRRGPGVGIGTERGTGARRSAHLKHHHAGYGSFAIPQQTVPRSPSLTSCEEPNSPSFSLSLSRSLSRRPAHAAATSPVSRPFLGVPFGEVFVCARWRTGGEREGRGASVCVSGGGDGVSLFVGNGSADGGRVGVGGA